MFEELERSARSVRADIFSRNWPLDEEMREVAATINSHSFLANPSGQYAFIYLTQFVKALSERHFCRPFDELRILDWGCGKGQVSKLIRDLGPKHLDSCDLLVGGSDSSFGQQTPILERFGIQVSPLKHEYVLPYDSEIFDVLLSFGVLEHVANERASLREIARVLRRGGMFFCFFLPTRFSWTQKVAHWGGNNYHERLYTEQDVRSMLHGQGMKVVDLWYRQLLPKNSVRYPKFRLFEKLDLFLTLNTPLRYLATNLEFVSVRS